MGNIAELEIKQADEAKMYDLINQSNRNISSDPNKALSEIEEALKLSFKNKNKRGEVFCYQSLGAIYFQKKNYEQAASYYQKAKDGFKAIGDNSGYYTSIKMLAAAYEGAKKYPQAIAEYREFLSLAQQKQSATDERLAKENLARVLFNNKQYTEANAFYQQLLVSFRSANQETKVSEMYELIGKCYAGQNDTAQALKYFGLAGIVADNYGNETDQSVSWQNVGRSYNSIGEYDKSNEYEKRAKKINQKNGDNQRVLDNNSNIAGNYLFMNKANEAIPFLQENLVLSNQTGQIKSTGETHKALSEAYAKLGKFEQAKASFDQYRQVQEQLLAEKESQLQDLVNQNSQFSDKENQIALLIKDKELDEKQISLLQKESNLKAENARQQKRINYILAALLVLMLLGLVMLYRSTKQKQIANKLLSIRSLRSQMNPHFIFNSLNSVNSFISKSDDRSANKYLSEFARLMRTVLEHSKKDFVLLSAELEVLERYLNLEHLRFKDHFDYVFEVDENLEIDRLLIPPMMVQPYIENAIWHGLRYKEEKGMLAVKFWKKNNAVLIEIKDNGIGRKRSEELKTKNQKMGKSTGISNTNGRIKLLNEIHNIHVKCSITDLDENETGTSVSIELPFLDVDDKKYAENA